MGLWRENLPVVVSVLALLTIALGFSAYQRYRAAAFFETVLKAQGIAAQGDSLSSLEVAYERAVAERAPLYGLSGTDPDALDKETDALARAQQDIADSLRLQSNIDYTRSSLYPTTFLHSLAAAERARLKFIASGSEADALAYRAALLRAADAQGKDAAAFLEAFIFLGYNHAEFPLLGGTMASDRMQQLVEGAVASSKANKQILARRERCFEGFFSSCDASDIALPVPAPVSSTRDAAATRRALENAALYAEAMPRIQNGPVVALASSTCLASVSGPYVFSDPGWRYRTSAVRPIQRYLGDFFFSTSTDAVSRLSKGEVTVPIDVYLPMNFYKCADKGLDVSRLRAIERTAAFARARPSLARDERAALLSGPILREDDAIAYVRAAEKSGASSADLSQLIALSLMFRDNSAGLDAVVNEVWALDENNLKLRKAGYPFDDSLLFLFGSHSGFATFFQTYNPSVVRDAPPLYDRSPGKLTLMLSRQLRYSEHREYRADVIQFLREYRKFEND